MSLRDLTGQGLAAIDPGLQVAITLGLIALLAIKEAVRIAQRPTAGLTMNLLDAALAPLTVVFAITFVLRVLTII